MHLAGLDWAVLAVCVVVIFAPAMFFARRGGRSVSEFFASGRAAPWWLVGTSMVATTFATDTPGLVTQLVREKGIAYNWIWWAFLLTGMATVFFYARLWRRSGALTDLEFYEIRYAGAPAALVRGFRALYLGLVFNCFIMATVTLAAVKIAAVLLGVPPWQTITFAICLCTLVSAVSGLWGVLVSDLVQFGLAITGSIAAAWYALSLDQVGGMDGLLHSIRPETLNLLPDFNQKGLVLAVLIIPLAVQWWAVWYPGAEPGGGSYIAQRILASKDERHAAGATLWFNVAHYALRPWPWIIVGLCSMLVFPELADLRKAFPHVSADLVKDDMAYPAMLTFLPAGVLGLAVASLLAAYVSTMSTHLNWGASYLVNDFYRRFIAPDASERQQVWISRFVTLVLMLLTALVYLLLNSSRQGFEVILSIGAGTGLIYLLRWFWWRINAWSEISAMISSFVVSVLILVSNHFLAAGWMAAGYRDAMLDQGLLEQVNGVTRIPGHIGLIVTVIVTTIVWVLVTYLTAPAPWETLVSFYRLVRPAGPGWSSIRREAGLSASPDSLATSLLAWVLGCMAVYSALFGAGSLLFHQTSQGVVLVIVFAVSTAALIALLSWSWRPTLPTFTKQ